jgi:hypothetical protein
MKAHVYVALFVQIEAGLSALEEALKAGYEDFKVTNCFAA